MNKEYAAVLPALSSHRLVLRMTFDSHNQFPFLVSASFDSSLEVIFGRSPVPSENFAGVTKKMAAKLYDRGLPGFTDDCRGSRAGCEKMSSPSYRRHACHYSCYFSTIASARRVELFLLFLAEFLESGIAAQRIPERIESKRAGVIGLWL